MYELLAVSLEITPQNEIVMRSVSDLQMCGVSNLLVLYDTQDYVHTELLNRLSNARDVLLWWNSLYDLSC